MATPVRTAKHGYHWTHDDLLAYRIQVDDAESASSFFGYEPNADLDAIRDHGLVNPRLRRQHGPSIHENTDLFMCIDLDSRPGLNQGSEADGFTFDLLRALGFESVCEPILLCSSRSFRLIVGGETKIALVDRVLFLLNCPADFPLLLVTYENADAARWAGFEPVAGNIPDPKARLVSAAIATFQLLARETKVDAVVFHGIVMAGTRPTLYKVPVTAALSRAVSCGDLSPEEVTRVIKCVVPSQSPSEDMESQEFRATALRYLLAFKDLVAEAAAGASSKFRNLQY